MKKWNIYSSKIPANHKELIDLILENRGITKNSDKENFLHPRLEDVTFKNTGIDQHQVDKTLDRIYDAIRKNEKIIIFGDYDVDGITGTAILWETFFWNLEYKNIHPYIPHRVNEGYGISEKGIDSVLKEYPETKLIITVDNGIVANDPIDYAISKNLDVIVTDHHTQKKDLPKAYSIIHTTKICGASVALFLSLALEKKKLEKNDTRLELAALATVADLVPLVDQNRIILSFGLNALRNSIRPGIKAMCEQAGIAQKNIGVYEIGHVIAPRLNAAGRLENALDSLRIVCTKDVNKARMLAQTLSNVNKKRQTMTEELIILAKENVLFDEKTKIIVSSSSEYNQGIIGLVASRLAENFYRPTLVISKGEEISKGSARSIKGVNIIELIRSASTFLTEVGGHPMAAGFALRTEHIELFVDELTKKAEEIINDSHFERSLSIDCELNEKFLNEETFKKIHELSPFGMGNHEPLFITENTEIVSVKRIGKDLNHISLKLKTGRSTISAVKFGIATDEVIPVVGQRMDIVFLLSINEWNGNKKLQLVVRDWRLADSTVSQTLN